MIAGFAVDPTSARNRRPACVPVAIAGACAACASAPATSAAAPPPSATAFWRTWRREMERGVLDGMSASVRVVVSHHVVAYVFGLGDVLVAIRLLGLRAADLQIALAAGFRIDRKGRQQPFELCAAARRTDRRIGVLRPHQCLEHLLARLTSILE